MKKKVLFVILSMVLVAGMLAGCGNSSSSEKGTIKIGAKDFSENIVVAELYALALEKEGYTVERDFSLSGQAAHEAITSDAIDIYPEYTGTGLCNQLGLDPVYDPQECYDLTKAGYAEQWNIVWLEPSQIDDAACYIMRKDVAEEMGITNISQAQAKANELVFGCHADTPDRAGYKKMNELYGTFNWKQLVTIDGNVQYEALDKGEITFTEALTTDPHLATGNYVVIEEDIPFSVPYYLTPIVRGEVLEANPEIETVLNKVSAALDNPTIIELVKRVDIDKEEATDVAKDFFDNNLQ